MKTKFSWMVMVLVVVVALAGCAPSYKVGELQSESKAVELEDAGAVRVEIEFAAGNLNVSGGADKLLEADFAYNVDRLKPEVDYKNGALVVSQPGSKGLPFPGRIGDFRNEWDLRLSDQAPMDLNVTVGAGSSDLKLAGLSLNRLNAKFGAGDFTIDLNGDWAHDLTASIEAGAANLSLRLPQNVGVRVVVESGPHTTAVDGLTKNGQVYTNAAYGVSDVTLEIHLQTGIGQINLAVAE